MRCQYGCYYIQVEPTTPMLYRKVTYRQSVHFNGIDTISGVDKEEKYISSRIHDQPKSSTIQNTTLNCGCQLDSLSVKSKVDLKAGKKVDMFWFVTISHGATFTVRMCQIKICTKSRVLS